MKSTTSFSFAKLSLATAAAALFAVTAVPAAQAAESGSSPVKCYGINACKGQTKCKTAENACAGQNVCKGHGWLLAPSASACTAKGGKVIK